MPDAAGLEIVANELRKNVAPDAVVETSFYRQQACIEVAPQHLLATLTWLKTDPTQAYNFLASVHGCDYLPQNPRLGVHYELLNMQRVERLRIKLRLDVDNAVVDSCAALFATAEFQEREIFDMFGVRFTGHNDMRRILMPEDYEGHPQRRDFALGGEPVLFTHNEPDAPGWYK